MFSKHDSTKSAMSVSSPTPDEYRYESPQIRIRFATPQDAALLAPLQRQLILDEGDQPEMSLAELEERLTGWLRGEYRAVLFLRGDETVGYALYRHEPEFVYLRNLFVSAKMRRQGIARNALRWLWTNAWQGVERVRLDVRVDNQVARAFWQSVGFEEYFITLEATRPGKKE